MRFDARSFAAYDPVAAARPPAIHLDEPGFDPRLDACARVLRQQPRQRLVEAPARELEGQLEQVQLASRTPRGSGGGLSRSRHFGYTFAP